MNNEGEFVCPVCQSDGNIIRCLSADLIRERLKNYFSDDSVKGLDLLDYQIFRCNNCKLEYSVPMQEGDESFYQWVASHSGYYPRTRWEWGILLERLNTSKKHLAILEVGCGEGEFMEQALRTGNASVVGLDTTEASTNICQSKGLNTYYGSLNNSAPYNDFGEKKFDFVVAFHCLEHVNDPREFVNEMLSELKPDGSVFISIPYSPMSFETIWFDPLNNPPHHLTRWNQYSLKMLASSLSAQIEMYLPKAQSAIARTLFTINLANSQSPSELMSKKTLSRHILLHPWLFMSEYFHQRTRELVNQTVASDVVLFEMKPSKCYYNK